MNETPEALETLGTEALETFFANDRERAGADSFIGDLHRTGISSSTVELLAFWADGEEYAVEINHIQEIIKLPQITWVPRAKSVVLGIISLRGTIVPIVDLRAVLRLRAQPTTRQTRILVLQVDNHPLGLMVDRVTSVVRLERETIEPKPRGIRRETTEYLEGVGRVGDRMLIVLDVPLLLSSLDVLA